MHFGSLFVFSSCQAVSTKKEAGENETECSALPGSTLLHSCWFSVYLDPVCRTTGPPENRLQPPQPCLPGFCIIIWTAHAKRAFPPSMPLSFCSTLLCQVGDTHKSVRWEEKVQYATNAEGTKSTRVWVDIVHLGFKWKYSLWTLYSVHLYNMIQHLHTCLHCYNPGTGKATCAFKRKLSGSCWPRFYINAQVWAELLILVLWCGSQG